MTVERTWFVRLPTQLDSRVRELEARALACAARAAKLDPGDRTEALRFEAIHAVIDQISAAALASGAQAVPLPEGDEVDSATILSLDPQGRLPVLPKEVVGWLREGSLVTRLRIPHESGSTPTLGELGRGPTPPAARWQAGSENIREAARERFDDLLTAALDGSQSRASVRPSDVSNIVLTESLRKAVALQPGHPPVELPVVYRDGSEGPRFPLRTLQMSDEPLPADWRILRFTLMSIRHVEMDTRVHGAWFRNSRLSRPRAAGLTDQLAFQISLKQLRELRPVTPAVIHMYQTGLEPAVIGFYRAVVVYLLAHPRTLAVSPHYYQGDGRFLQGTPWRMP